MAEPTSQKENAALKQQIFYLSNLINSAKHKKNGGQLHSNIQQSRTSRKTYCYSKKPTITSTKAGSHYTTLISTPVISWQSKKATDSLLQADRNKSANIASTSKKAQDTVEIQKKPKCSVPLKTNSQTTSIAIQSVPKLTPIKAPSSTIHSSTSLDLHKHSLASLKKILASKLEEKESRKSVPAKKIKTSLTLSKTAQKDSKNESDATKLNMSSLSDSANKCLTTKKLNTLPDATPKCFSKKQEVLLSLTSKNKNDTSSSKSSHLKPKDSLPSQVTSVQNVLPLPTKSDLAKNLKNTEAKIKELTAELTQLKEVAKIVSSSPEKVSSKPTRKSTSHKSLHHYHKQSINTSSKSRFNWPRRHFQSKSQSAAKYVISKYRLKKIPNKKHQHSATIQNTTNFSKKSLPIFHQKSYMSKGVRSKMKYVRSKMRYVSPRCKRPSTYVYSSPYKYGSKLKPHGVKDRSKTIIVRGVKFQVGQKGKTLKRFDSQTNTGTSTPRNQLKTISRVDYRGITYVETKPGMLEKLTSSQSRWIASHLVHKSIVLSRPKRRKTQRQYCMFYCRFGKCNRGDKCTYIHDPDKVAVCTSLDLHKHSLASLKKILASKLEEKESRKSVPAKKIKTSLTLSKTAQKDSKNESDATKLNMSSLSDSANKCLTTKKLNTLPDATPKCFSKKQEVLLSLTSKNKNDTSSSKSSHLKPKDSLPSQVTSVQNVLPLPTKSDLAKNLKNTEAKIKELTAELTQLKEVAKIVSSSPEKVSSKPTRKSTSHKSLHHYHKQSINTSSKSRFNWPRRHFQSKSQSAAKYVISKYRLKKIPNKKHQHSATIQNTTNFSKKSLPIFHQKSYMSKGVRSKMKYVRSKMRYVSPRCKRPSTYVYSSPYKYGSKLKPHGVKDRSKTIIVRGVKFQVGQKGKTLKRFDSQTNTGTSTPRNQLKTISRVDYRGITYVETKPGMLEKLTSSQSRWIASHLVHKSIVLSRPKRRKTQRQYCMFYCRFGKCNRGDKCTYIHDPDKVAVCTRFLRGTCKIENCKFSHKVSKDKMPVCSYFLRGLCFRENCPYLHVKVDENAKVCKDFLKGFCPKGEKCKEKHIRECPEFSKSGQCSAGKKCPLEHRINYLKRKLLSSQRKNTRVCQEPEVVPPSAGTSKQTEALEGKDWGTIPFKMMKLPAFISLISQEDDDTSQSNIASTTKLPLEPLRIKPRL